MQKTAALAILVIIALLLTAGCSQPTTAPSPTPLPTPVKHPVTTKKAIPITTATPIQIPTERQTPTVSDNTITIHDDLFDPGTLTVKAGATVRWYNTDVTTQRLKFADNSFSQIMSTGQSWSRIFNSPGIYDYTSSVNQRMHGTIRVV